MHHFVTLYEVLDCDVLPRRVEVGHETEHVLRLRQLVGCLAGGEFVLIHRHDQRLLEDGFVFLIGRHAEDPRKGVLRLAPGDRFVHTKFNSDRYLFD